MEISKDVVLKEAVIRKAEDTKEDRYEVLCSVNNDSHKGILLLKEEKDNCQIELLIGDLNIDGEAENYFYALIELRKKLEMQNIKLLCKGCSRHVYPSPMILDMGDARKAYELTLGKQALMSDLVDIFTACEYDEYASIKEQYDYYEKWLESRRKTT